MKSKEQKLSERRAYIAAFKTRGLCACGRPVVPEKKQCASCRLSIRQSRRRLRASAPVGVCSACLKKPPVSGRRTCAGCAAYANAHQKKTYDELYRTVLDAYGRVCKCCGETNPGFLSIDHVNNDAYIERRERGYHNSLMIMRQIIREGFPARFQVLCFSCNVAKNRFGGHCPHTPEGRTRVEKKFGVPHPLRTVEAA